MIDVHGPRLGVGIDALAQARKEAEFEVIMGIDKARQDQTALDIKDRMTRRRDVALQSLNDTVADHYVEPGGMLGILSDAGVAKNEGHGILGVINSQRTGAPSWFPVVAATCATQR